jgi:hypothetical protein
MNMKLDCYPCMIGLAIRTARMIGCTEEQVGEMVDWTLRALLERRFLYGPPGLTADMYEFMHQRFCGDIPVFDPFKHIKTETNRIAATFLPHVRGLMDAAHDRLGMAVRVAAAGNIIDFGALAHGSIDIDREIREIESLSFNQYDIEPLRNRASHARRILYLADNAGEIVFDTVLLDELRRCAPDAAIALAVRDRPILNDATLDDCEELRDLLDAELGSSGSRYPGTVLAEASPALRERFAVADLIVAKGQGNYETLCEDRREGLFFVMRVKCEQVARDIGAAVGDLVLHHAP